jgi:hypothetical protein
MVGTDIDPSLTAKAGQLAMMQILLIGLGAGAAAALLFASVASGSILSLVLFYLAPLPILIAAIGWSHWAGLIAALASAVGLGLVFSFKFLTAYLIGVGLPAWWLGYLAMLARPGATPGDLEWYPPGMLVLWAAVLSALSVVLAIPYFGFDQASFEGALRNGFERVLRAQTNSPADGPLTIPGSTDPNKLLDFLVAIIPPAAAALGTITHLANLWLAGRVIKVSGGLRRPWPDVPSMRFPAHAAGLTALALAASFMPGLIGIVGSVFSAALLLAYGALGLAVLHVLTRATNVRALLLGGVYAALFLLGWPILLASLLGLADVAFDFRGRAARRGPPTLRT